MKKKVLWKGLGLVFVIVAVILIVMNQQRVGDWWRGLHYQPVGEMEQIMGDLGLTSEGEFLFRAVQPVLSSRDDFNAKCREVMDEEMAVLGCYTEGDVYVYDIDAEELDGIRELTDNCLI